MYERAGTRVHATRFIIARRVGDDRWERHGDERGVDDEYDGGARPPVALSAARPPVALKAPPVRP